jgi:hypothetical protein
MRLCILRFITASLVCNALSQVINLYKGRGNQVEELEFNEATNPIHTILADN